MVNKMDLKIKELRAKKGLTQEELAYEIGVTLSSIQRWEKNSCKPNRICRRELCRLFKEAGIDLPENWTER